MKKSGIPIDNPPGSLDIQNDESKKNDNKNTIIEKNITQKNTENIEKEKNNTKEKKIINEKNKKEQEKDKKNNKGKGNADSSPFKELKISTPHDQNINKRKYTETPITPSAPPFISHAQQQIIWALNKDKNNIECPNCTNLGTISVTNIDLEIELMEFTCIICKKTVDTTTIMDILPSYQRNKKKTAAPNINTEYDEDTHVTDAVSPLVGTNEYLISEVDKLTTKDYMINKEHLICPSCTSKNSIKRNGHSSSNKQPRPIFKCNQCDKTFTIDRIREIISQYNTTKSSSKNVEDISDTDSVAYMDTMDTEQQTTNNNTSSTRSRQPSIEIPYQKIDGDILAQIKSLVLKVDSHEKQFIYYNSIFEENQRLQKENILQKNEIEYLKKKLLEQEKNTQEQNTSKNNTKENNTEKNIKEKNNKKNNNMNTLTNLTDPPSPNSIYQSKYAPNSNTQQSYASVTSTKLPVNNKKAHYRTQIYRNSQITEKSIELAARTFNSTVTTSPPNYVFLHFPCKTRMKPSDIRKKLTLLGIDNVRVLDAHCPDWNIVALLVHENYVNDIKKKFQLAKVGNVEYDYFDPIHLRDSRLNEKTAEEKSQLLQEIRKNYLKRIINRIRYPVNQSVAKSFHRNGNLTLEELKSWISEYRSSKVTTLDGFTRNLQQEENSNNNNMELDEEQPQQIADSPNQAQIDTSTPTPPSQ